jgi:hypothetical protein
MKKLILFLSLILLLSNCKDKEPDACVGPDCPLSDGTTCPGNMINIDDQCVCAEGTQELNTGICWEGPGTSPNPFFYFEFDCECATGDLIISVTNDDPIYGAYSLDKGWASNENRIGGPINFLPGSTRADFDGQLYPASCNNKYFYIHGGMNNDTMSYELYFLNTSTMDTCGPFVAYPL